MIMSAWFFGADHRRWYRDTPGYQIVAAWHRNNAECSTAKWLSVAANEVIAAGLADGLLAK